MAVKNKGTLPPPMYGTGGKAEHYAIEVLRAEYELIMERIKSMRGEPRRPAREKKIKIRLWNARAAMLEAASNFLQANKSKIGFTKLPAEAPTAHAAPAPPAGVHAIASCRNFAKCGEFSYFYCFSRCEKRKNKTCDLVSKHTRKKPA